MGKCKLKKPQRDTITHLLEWPKLKVQYQLPARMQNWDHPYIAARNERGTATVERVIVFYKGKHIPIIRPSFTPGYFGNLYSDVRSSLIHNC